MHRLSLALTRLESRTVPAAIRVTSLADAGPGTLRAALAEADARPGKDTIVFKLPAPPAHSENVITLTSGELTSKGNVTISGPGAGRLIVSGNGASRVFDITDNDPAADHPASISGLSIVSGHVTGLGAIGGGISSTESLSLTGVTLSGNTGDRGGAVYVNGGAGARSVKIARSLVSGNTANGRGGGLALYHLTSVQVTSTTITGNLDSFIGGGLYASLAPNGTGVTVSGCTITGNTALFGGGVFLQNFSTVATAKTIVTGCTVVGNLASGAGRGGGGLYLESGRIAVSGCTISGNVAVHQGGGVVASGFTTLTISRTAVTGNATTQATDPGDGGGGLFIFASVNFDDPIVPATISGCTVSNNSTPGSGGGALVGYGLRLTVTGSTFAGDVASGSGGGLCATGAGTDQVALTVAGCTFAGDRATNSGGGLFVSGDGPVLVRSTRVAGCASGVGGGVYARSAAADGFVMSGCTLTGNIAPSGGGLAVFNTPTFHVSGSSFANNWASSSGGGIEVWSSGGSILGTRVAGNASAVAGGVYHFGNETVLLDAAGVRGNTAPSSPDLFGTFTFV